MPRLLALALVVSAVPASAQFPGTDLVQPVVKRPRGTAYDLADITFEVSPAKAKRGDTVTAKLTVAPKLVRDEKGWTYPFFPKDPGQAARNNLGTLPATADFVYLPVADPAGRKEKPRADAPGKADEYYPEPVTWEFRVVVPLKATPGKKTLTLGSGTRLQVCNDRNCLPLNGENLPTAELEVADETAPAPNAADLAEANKLLAEADKFLGVAPPTRATPPAATPPATAPATPTGEGGRKPAKSLVDYERDLEAVRASLVFDDAGGAAGPGGKPDQGLGAFLATAALWGLISLITPCVFPMIPITVSIFLKQAHGSMGQRLKLAGVYSLTIITVLGVSAFALLKFMAVLAAHPATNIALGALFFVLALSLFGMYELTLPNSLARRLQSRQSQGGVVGTVFGALAFTVISFTCVAPFLGGFAGISAAGGDGTLIALPTAREVLGGLAFATAFAAPFFVLALVPGLLKALPRSGGWLDSVKVVMGFLELAAALKFLRTAELRLLPTPEVFTYDLVLAGWVALAAACGLYLLNIYRLPHDEERPNIGVPRLLFAALFLGLAVYLAPALFKTADGKHPRPAGGVYAWVEAFLLPEREAGEAAGTDLREAVERARKARKPVFVDFTGVTCTNCKVNERNVFPRPEIKALLSQFVEVQLFTDEVPAEAFRTDPGRAVRLGEAEANRSFEVAAFGTVSLPTYAVLLPQPDGSVRVYREPAGERRGLIEGKLNDPADFAAFLRAALDAAR